MKMTELLPLKMFPFTLTLLHSERPKLHTILAFLSAIGLTFIRNLSFCRLFTGTCVLSNTIKHPLDKMKLFDNYVEYLGGKFSSEMM